MRTCPRAGPPSTGTPKARATATAHGVFFPTGTVIAAGKGRRLPLSPYWRNSPAPESGGGFARGYSCMRKEPRREREPIGPNGWAQIPYPGGNNGVRRVSTPKNTVPCGKFPRGRGRHYRTQREVLPFCPGNNSVLYGKHYRTSGEWIPFSTGSITVPVGNGYRSLREALPYPWGTLSEIFPAKGRKTRRRRCCACLC